VYIIMTSKAVDVLFLAWRKILGWWMSFVEKRIKGNTLLLLTVNQRFSFKNLKVHNINIFAFFFLFYIHFSVQMHFEIYRHFLKDVEHKGWLPYIPSHFANFLNDRMAKLQNDQLIFSIRKRKICWWWKWISTLRCQNNHLLMYNDVKVFYISNPRSLCIFTETIWVSFLLS
jgi:hypothetical protein